ncbi:hypothetical protein D3C72_2286810 [compost metagenome]|jgi:hypothetical protein
MALLAAINARYQRQRLTPGFNPTHQSHPGRVIQKRLIQALAKGKLAAKSVDFVAVH